MAADDSSDEDMLGAEPESSTAQVTDGDGQLFHLHPYMLIAFKLQKKRKHDANQAQSELYSRPSSAGTANPVLPGGERVLSPMNSGVQSVDGPRLTSVPSMVLPTGGAMQIEAEV